MQNFMKTTDLQRLTRGINRIPHFAYLSPKEHSVCNPQPPFRTLQPKVTLINVTLSTILKAMTVDYITQ